MLVRRMLLFVAATLVAPIAHTQSSPPAVAAVPAFEVVSVKANRSGTNRMSFQLTPDGFVARNMQLMWFIQVAYGAIEQRMVSGAPDWTNTERYDVDAKVDGSDVPELAKLSSDQRNSMLQPILEERFKLRYHFETRDLPDFALVVGKSGPKGLTESKQTDPVSPPQWKITGRYQMSVHGMTMAELCRIILSTESQRLVVDRTGLKAKYDFALQWSRDDPAAKPADAPPPEASGPSIFTALQEQLGLKLVPTMVPTRVLVIDHIERPSEN